MPEGGRVGCRAPGEEAFPPPLYLEGRRRVLETWAAGCGRRMLK